jgi:hypothetical protein
MGIYIKQREGKVQNCMMHRILLTSRFTSHAIEREHISRILPDQGGDDAP